ncbi:hypothetical protein [Sphingomonas sp.]|uniref:hypothetical protein n=1 Tax=Sphingomonas sp. TaxID=28214 RepID=UPI002589B52A|nr:hypothetical protein [Sphingomonas sp.]
MTGRPCVADDAPSSIGHLWRMALALVLAFPAIMPTAAAGQRVDAVQDGGPPNAPAGADAVGIAQVNERQRPDPVADMRLDPPVRAPAVAQIGSADRAIASTPSAAQRDLGTQAGPPLAQAGDSRALAVARIAGHDRCDPQGARNTVAPSCKTVIETRADSFATERRDLSPEQRLAAERDAAEDRRGIVTEAKRAGSGGIDPTSSDGQALAAFLQAEQARAAAAAEAAANAAKTGAAVSVAVSVLNGGK